MKKPYIISFFIDEVPIIETMHIFSKIQEIIPQYFREHEKIYFLHCADNVTEGFAHKAVINVRNDFSQENYLTVKVYPYCYKGYIRCVKNNQIGSLYYEKHLSFRGAYSGDKETAYITRNKKMADMSDLLFFFIKEQGSLSDETLKYAQKLGKEIVFL
ncbi:MAG: hypothetical protein IKK85_08720 [Clostridia bacterium]|nr:hypothetical protein [Clostridia bacterium]